MTKFEKLLAAGCIVTVQDDHHRMGVEVDYKYRFKVSVGEKYFEHAHGQTLDEAIDELVAKQLKERGYESRSLARDLNDMLEFQRKLEMIVG